MKRYRLDESAIKVAVNGACVAKTRVVGIFPTRIRRIRAVIQHLKSIGQLIDVTEGKGATGEARSLILLDSGHAVLSPFTPRTLAAAITGEEEDS